MDFKGMGGAGGEAPLPSTPLTRQGSIYSLTFDEFQSMTGGIGKDFGSMNMDELLKNIWTAEESYAVASALGDSSGGTGAGLQSQGSLTLPRTLSQKTVDEANTMELEAEVAKLKEQNQELLKKQIEMIEI